MGMAKSQLEKNTNIKVKFKCTNVVNRRRCGHWIEDEVENAIYDFGEDSPGDAIATALSFVDCDKCGMTYNVEVIDQGAEKLVRIQDHDEINVSYEDPTENYMDDWDYDNYILDYEAPDPYSNFEKAIADIRGLELRSQIPDDLKDAFNRMLYLHYVVALEAYLSDRLIGVVMNDKYKLLCIVGNIEVIRNQKKTFMEILKSDFDIEKTVKDYLQKVSFHDLATVEAYFVSVLKTSLFENTKHKEEMDKAIQIRHDIAHRNGTTVSGKPNRITMMDVELIRANVMKIVDRVEAGFKKYDTERAAKLKEIDDMIQF